MLTVKGNLLTSRATFTKVTGLAICAMGEAYLSRIQEVNMRDSGTETHRRELGLRYGRRAPISVVHIQMGRKMALASTIGMMGHSTRAIGRTIKSPVLGRTGGPTRKSSQVSGWPGKWLGSASTRGQMVDAMRDFSVETSDRAMGFT